MFLQCTLKPPLERLSNLPMDLALISRVQSRYGQSLLLTRVSGTYLMMLLQHQTAHLPVLLLKRIIPRVQLRPRRISCQRIHLIVSIIEYSSMPSMRCSLLELESWAFLRYIQSNVRKGDILTNDSSSLLEANLLGSRLFYRAWLVSHSPLTADVAPDFLLVLYRGVQNQTVTILFASQLILLKSTSPASTLLLTTLRTTNVVARSLPKRSLPKLLKK